MFTSLRLQNFRSYDEASFEFGPSVNIIVGPNASGKTNLLEAILVLCRGGSYRARDIDLVQINQEWARIDGINEANETRSVKLQKADERVDKSFVINEVSKKRLNFMQTIPVVLFEPNQLQSITTSPSQRRLFLDELLSQIDSEYATQKRAYERILAQRNALLKQKRTSTREQLFVWNLRLSEFGEVIAQKRLSIILELNKKLSENYQKIAGTKDDVSLTYKTEVNTEQYGSALLKKLEDDSELDLLRGFTGAGPHRDDVEIIMNEHPLAISASRGETRTVLLSLKIQEVQMLEAARGIRPLLLFDDVFSELDGIRRKSLTAFLQDYQTFITTTDADVIAHDFAQAAKLLMLSE